MCVIRDDGFDLVAGPRRHDLNPADRSPFPQPKHVVRAKVRIPVKPATRSDSNPPPVPVQTSHLFWSNPGHRLRRRFKAGARQLLAQKRKSAKDHFLKVCRGEQWRLHYNQVRPHSVLGYLTPSTFKPSQATRKRPFFSRKPWPEESGQVNHVCQAQAQNGPGDQTD
uniref:integrase core domain-containing protein n=1 Tax=Niveibacterium sp. SC-1 TaxID=3135646 RepID=UPI0040540D5C